MGMSKKKEEELYNKLVKYLYNIFDNELRPDLLERGFTYFGYNNVIKETCEELAENQEEYDYYFMNYHRALNHVKSFFIEDIKKMNAEKELQNKQQQEKTEKKEQEEKKKFTIFGMNPILAILLAPIILFFDILDHDK